MNGVLVPVAKPRLELGFFLFLLGELQVLEQEAELLSEGGEGLPPVGAAVLVLVAHEELVEEGVDVVQHGLFVGSRDQQGCGGDGGHHGGADGHCEGGQALIW